MTTSRRRLPNRRGSVTFDLESQGLKFTCTASWFEDGSLAEILLTNHRAGSQAGVNAQDFAVVASIALQFGVPLEDTPAAHPPCRRPQQASHSRRRRHRDAIAARPRSRA